MRHGLRLQWLRLWLLQVVVEGHHRLGLRHHPTHQHRGDGGGR